MIMEKSKKCLCENKEFDSDLFILIPRYNMTCPLIHYFMCKRCGKIYKTIKEGNSFVEYFKKEEGE